MSSHFNPSVHPFCRGDTADLAEPYSHRQWVAAHECYDPITDGEEEGAVVLIGDEFAAVQDDVSYCLDRPDVAPAGSQWFGHARLADLDSK